MGFFDPIVNVGKSIVKPTLGIGTKVFKPLTQLPKSALNLGGGLGGLFGGLGGLAGGLPGGGAGGLVDSFLPSTETMVKIGVIAGVGLIAYKKIF